MYSWNMGKKLLTAPAAFVLILLTACSTVSVVQVRVFDASGVQLHAATCRMWLVRGETSLRIPVSRWDGLPAAFSLNNYRLTASAQGDRLLLQVSVPGYPDIERYLAGLEQLPRNSSSPFQYYWDIRLPAKLSR